VCFKSSKNKESLFLGLETNSQTLDFLKDKNIVITDYDGKTLKKIDVVFSDDLTVSKKFLLKI
ncbi:MAG: hypothetical protein HC798_01560, partial [Polaribacter sp.]|nr:hypothetical protein [Polaribacter sp.]